MSRDPFERALRRDRLLVLGAVAGITALAWAYVIRLAAGMDMPGMAMPEMMAPMPAAWTATDFLLMWLMWSVMMVGMMAPSVAPMVLLYARVGREAQARGKPFAATAWFGGGYLLAWSVFSLAATAAQWTLERAALMSPATMALGTTLGGGVLVAAGLYQFTPFKNACLAQCQAPLVFIQRHGGFRADPRGALRLGCRHGLYCVGCCWALMAILFAVGVMNLIWVAALAALVLIEKLLPRGHGLPRATGLALVAAGLWVIFG
jgi:predicted metal-binding membrane protein